MPTLTDSAVAAGRADLGDAGRTSRYRRILLDALARADVMLAEAIDRVKTSKEDRALVAVGGGSILVPDRIPGVSEVIRPEHFDTANAVGAAIASVSGQVDRIFHLGPRAGRRYSTRHATRRASARSRRAPTPARCRSSSWRKYRSPTSPLQPSGCAPRPPARSADCRSTNSGAGNLSRQARLAGAAEQAAESPSRTTEATMKPHRALPIASGCAVALLLAACGGSSSSTPQRAASARCLPTTRPRQSWTTAGIRRRSTPTASSR